MKNSDAVRWDRIDRLREQSRQALRARRDRLTRLADNILTRKRRIALDLILALTVAWAAWYGCGCPLYGEAAFRRLERQNFLAPGEIVFHQGRPLGPGADRLAKEVYISLGEDWAAVGYLDGRGEYDYWKPLGPGTYTMVWVEDAWMELWSLAPGPAVIPLLFPVCGPDKGDVLGWGAAALRMPQEAAGGELSVVDRGGNEHVLAGLLQEPGTLWFWEADQTTLSGGFHVSDNRQVLGEPWMPGLDYTLRLYRPDGSLLLEREGKLPDA